MPTVLKDIVLKSPETEAPEFTVSYWKVDPGERVAPGDELVVVESVEDKTALAITSSHAGVLTEILAREDETVASGTTLGRIEVE